MRSAVWLVLLVSISASAFGQTIHWKKDHVYNGPGGKEIAVLTPAPTDTTAPSKPTSLSSTSVTATSVSLSWTGSTDTGGSGLAGYKVYRQQGTGANLPVGTLGPGVTTFVDQPLTPSTSYTYTVVAFDNAENHSTWTTSDQITRTTSGYTAAAPTAPTNLVGTVLNSSTIRLDWQASTDLGGPGVKGYTISRNGTVISGASPITNVYFQDTGLTANTTYNYSITASDNLNNASSAATASVTTARRLVFKDNFARADGDTGLVNCSYQVSSSWYSCWAGYTPWTTLSHHAAIPLSLAGWNFIASGQGFNTDIKATVTLTSNPFSAGIYFWDGYPWASPVSYYVAYVTGTTLKLSFISPGPIETVLATATVPAAVGTISIDAAVSSRLINVSYNGTLKISFTETVTSRPNAGRAGMLANDTPGTPNVAYFDNFMLEN